MSRIIQTEAFDRLAVLARARDGKGNVLTLSHPVPDSAGVRVALVPANLSKRLPIGKPLANGRHEFIRVLGRPSHYGSS